MASSSEPSPAPPETPSRSATRSGVTNTPNRLDAAALQMAAGMLPRASEVNAMADCTVAGSAHR
jgi:hypothetical protein